jgi:hypothetical protein
LVSYRTPATGTPSEPAVVIGLTPEPAFTQRGRVLGREVALFCPHCGALLASRGRCPACKQVRAPQPTSGPDGGQVEWPSSRATLRRGRRGHPSRTRTLWLIPLALLFGWLYASPYLAVHSLRQAALDGDAESLREAVDFPALRASLKEELGGQLSKDALAELRKDNNGFAALGSALLGGFANLMVDQLVTPQGVASIVRGQRADGTPDELASALERFATRPQQGAGKPEARIFEGYESLGRFCVRIFPPKCSAPITLVWLRSGVARWRLSGIRLPDLDELTKAVTTVTPTSRAPAPAETDALPGLAIRPATATPTPDPDPNAERIAILRQRRAEVAVEIRNASALADDVYRDQFRCLPPGTVGSPVTCAGREPMKYHLGQQTQEVIFDLMGKVNRLGEEAKYIDAAIANLKAGRPESWAPPAPEKTWPAPGDVPMAGCPPHCDTRPEFAPHATSTAPVPAPTRTPATRGWRRP